jgi:hypothetical protein
VWKGSGKTRRTSGSAEAQVEKDMLVQQLRENLEELSRKHVFENQKNEADYHQSMLQKIPLKIYVG